MESVLNHKISASDRQQAFEMACRKTVAVPLWKRLLDATIILVASPVAILVGAIIAVVIKIGSPGPVIFRQERVGYKGQRFTCFKFRTMYAGVETSSHQGYTTTLIKSETPMTKLDASTDSRIIPLGSIMRAAGLDELPQLINVLRGEMSLVGPRPCVGYEYDMYETWQKRRFDAVPGLTGLWQVSGKNRTTFNQMINLDIEYSEQMSLWLDLKIIFKTVPALGQQCREHLIKRKHRKAKALLAEEAAASQTEVSSRVKIAG